MRLTLIVLGIATAQQRARQIQLQLPAGEATLTYEETDDLDAVAAAFVRENGVNYGAGCTADPSCVAERIADQLRAKLAAESRHGGLSGPRCAC